MRLFKDAFVLLLCVLLFAGCRSDETNSGTSSVAPTATGAPIPNATTGSTSTTSTTVPVDPGELADFLPPSEILSSFGFRLSMLNEAAESFGIVSFGVFVAPDAVSCEVGNPAFVSPALGVGTAIGSDFWFDDGLFAGEPSRRSDDFALDWLATCPGDPDYWTRPIFLDDRFSADFVGGGDEIGGYATYVYELSSNSPELELTEARVWLTEDAWPIQVSIKGSVLGGVISFLGATAIDRADPDEIADAFEAIASELEGDGGTGENTERSGTAAETADDPTPSMIPFEIQLSIAQVNGAQVVRAPDGSVTVGPLNDPVVTLDEPAVPSIHLARAMAAALDSPCYQVDSLSALVTPDQLESLHVSQINQSSQGDESNFTMITPGMAGGGMGTQVTSSAPADLALHHAEILFNHRAPIVALFDWLGWVPPEMERDGEIYISLVAPSGSGGEPTLIASWNGQSISTQDGSTEERQYHYYLAYPDKSLALDSTSESEARSVLGTWRAQTIETASGLLEHDLQAATNLEYLYEIRDVVRQQACALLGTAWVHSDAALAGNDDATAALVDEVAAQHLILSLEYLDLLGGYLESAGIDWLRAEGIDLDTGFLAGDNPGTIISFWTNLLLEALTLGDPATYG